MTRDLFFLKMETWQSDLKDAADADWCTAALKDDLRSLWLELEAVREDFTKSLPTKS